MTDVKLLAGWNGWCDPCEVERPLLLTEFGPRGLRSWMSGIGIEDRTLHLTCRVCGHWQLVPQLEEDDELTPAELAQLGLAARAEAEATLHSALEGELADDKPATRSLLRAFHPRGRRAEVTDATDLADEAADEPKAERRSPFARFQLARRDVIEQLEALQQGRALPVPAPEPVSVPAEAAKAAETAIAALAAISAMAAEDDETPARRSRFAGLRRTRKDEDGVAETVEAVSEAVAEVVEEVPVERRRPAAVAPKPEPAPVRSIAPDADDEVTVRVVAAPAVPAIVSTALVPERTPEAPKRKPTVVTVPVPRTAPSPVRSVSATDTALLALLAEGLDVVSAGRR